MAGIASGYVYSLVKNGDTEAVVESNCNDVVLLEILGHIACKRQQLSGPLLRELLEMAAIFSQMSTLQTVRLNGVLNKM